MKTDEVYWSLAKPSEAKQIDGLTLEQARFLVWEIPADQHKEWKVWREGLTRWLSLIECPELIKTEDRIRRLSPPLPPPEINEFSMVSDLASLVAGKGKVVDLRLSRRFVKSFAVQLESSKSGAFSTHTQDISVGGMKLADPVPEIFGTSFNAIISRSDGEQIKLYCKIIKNSERKRLKFLDVDKPRVIQSWLIDSKPS